MAAEFRTNRSEQLHRHRHRRTPDNTMYYVQRTLPSEGYMHTAAEQQWMHLAPQRPIGTGAYLPRPSSYGRVAQWTPDSNKFVQTSGTGVFLPPLPRKHRFEAYKMVGPEQQRHPVAEKAEEEEAVVQPRSLASEYGLPDEWPY